MMRWTRLLPVFATMLVVTFGKMAYGIDFSKSSSEIGPEGTWTNFCEIDRMTDAKFCRLMVYRLFEDNKEVGFVSLSVIPNGTEYNLFLTTSQGMIENCALRVDRQPRYETQVATLNMCMFPIASGSKFLDQFKAGSTVLVRVNFMRGSRRDIDFTLNGFSRNFEEMQRNLQ